MTDDRPGLTGGRIRTLINRDRLQAKIAELGAQITAAHREHGEDLVLVVILKGSFVFAADLARAIDLPLRVEFFGVRSYEGTNSSGVVQTTLDLNQSIEGKHVVIVEDIVDTGLTLSYIRESFLARRPASLELCSLLHKPARTKVRVPIDHLGFTIEDVFVVGYGLDFDGRYRNLPWIGVYEP
jgi:hypoxanthine phosphoribosyltransferase